MSPAAAEGVGSSLLEARLKALEQKREWSPGVLGELKRVILKGTDLDLFRVNPIRYSAAHSVEESESIDLFLNAVDVGLFWPQAVKF